ncbi:hypothetical protein ACOK4R_32195 (plasmid) [Pseudomonas fluorescens]|uniref:hypothetical protein n=1 Tax=Pseudomonas TaxID=286 RepID=UPI001F135A29|nr:MULTISPECIES: hypothetical protein [Pseudomonas]
MSMSEEQRALYKRLEAKSTWVDAYCGADMNRLPVRGQMLFVGFCMAPLAYRLGFVVQIRLKQGDFGSHNFLMRMADGSLHQHSNNKFDAISDEDTQALLPFFVGKPATEQYELGYSVGSPDSGAAGYLIASEQEYPRQDNGAAQSMPLVDAAGSIQMADLVYI